MATFDNMNPNDHHYERQHTHYNHSHGQDGCHYKHLTREEMLKLPFEERVAYAGVRHVFYQKTGSFHEHINLVALARMSLYALQKELLDQFVTITRSEPMVMDSKTASNIRRLLHEYCEALRDREYMAEKSKLNIYSNPFVLQKGNFMDKALMDDLVRDFHVRPHDFAHCPRRQDRGFDVLPGGPWDPETQEKTKQELQLMELKKETERYLMALIGSLILVGPMLLMALVKGIVVRLVTAGVCTVIFAFAFAKFSERTPLELMSITAAYTAVLVVFVGASTGS